MRIRINLDYELSPRAKRLLKIGLPTVVLLAGGVALASVPHTFSDGDLLSAQAMNDNFTSLDTRLSKLESLVGASGDGGLTNDSGQPLSAAIVWKDSKGVTVPIVRMLGDPSQNAVPNVTFEFFDAASNAVWMYTSLDGTVRPTTNSWVGYPGNNCGGTPYAMIPPGPRYAFALTTDANTFYVSPDNTQWLQMGIITWYNGNSCQNSALSSYVVPVSSLVKVTKPSAPPGTPPYHPEPL